MALQWQKCQNPFPRPCWLDISYCETKLVRVSNVQDESSAVVLNRWAVALLWATEYFEIGHKQIVKS